MCRQCGLRGGSGEGFQRREKRGALNRYMGNDRAREDIWLQESIY